MPLVYRTLCGHPLATRLCLDLAHLLELNTPFAGLNDNCGNRLCLSILSLFINCVYFSGGKRSPQGLLITCYLLTSKLDNL